MNLFINKNINENAKIVVKNSIFSMMGMVLGQCAALFSSLVMGRMLGAEGLGIYTFALTFSGVIFLFLNLGIGSVFQRNISQDMSSAGKNYANALALRIFFSLPISLVISIATVYVTHRKEEIWMFLLACIYTGLTGIFSLVSEGISAIEKFQITFVFSMAQKTLCLITTFFTLYFTRSLLIMLICHDIIFVFLIIAELLYVNKVLCKIKLEIDIVFCKRILKESFPTIFGSAAEYLSLKSDILILTFLIGETAAGLYSISSNVYIAASFVPLAMAKAATPTFNRMVSNKENVKNLVRKTFQIMTITSVMLILGIFVIGRFGIILLWGNDFEGATDSLRILSISLLFMPANRFLEYMLVGLKRQLLVAKCTIVGAVFNIIANILLVPLIGLNAVAYTTVTTEFIVMALELYFFVKI